MTWLCIFGIKPRVPRALVCDLSTVRHCRGTQNAFGFVKEKQLEIAQGLWDAVVILARARSCFARIKNKEEKEKEEIYLCPFIDR